MLTQCTLHRVLGQARLQRLIRAGWLKPVERTPTRVFYREVDVHAALRRLERQRLPPDRIEITRVRLSEQRNGHERVRKEKPPVLDLSAMELDFSTFRTD